MIIKPVETHYEDEYFTEEGSKNISFYGVYLSDDDDAYQWIAAFRAKGDAILFIEKRQS